MYTRLLIWGLALIIAGEAGAQWADNAWSNHTYNGGVIVTQPVTFVSGSTDVGTLSTSWQFTNSTVLLPVNQLNQPTGGLWIALAVRSNITVKVAQPTNSTACATAVVITNLNLTTNGYDWVACATNPPAVAASGAWSGRAAAFSNGTAGLNCAATNVPQLIAWTWTQISNGLSFFFPVTNGELNVMDRWTYDATRAADERDLVNNATLSWQAIAVTKNAAQNLNLPQWKAWILANAGQFAALTNGVSLTPAVLTNRLWTGPGIQLPSIATGALVIDTTGAQSVFTNHWTWSVSETNAPVWPPPIVLTNKPASDFYHFPYPLANSIEETLLYVFGLPYDRLIFTTNLTTVVPGWFAGQPQTNSIPYNWTQTNSVVVRSWFHNSPAMKYDSGNGLGNLVTQLMPFAQVFLRWSNDVTSLSQVVTNPIKTQCDTRLNVAIPFTQTNGTASTVSIVASNNLFYTRQATALSFPTNPVDGTYATNVAAMALNGWQENYAGDAGTLTRSLTNLLSCTITNAGQSTNATTILTNALVAAGAHESDYASWDWVRTILRCLTKRGVHLGLSSYFNATNATVTGRYGTSPISNAVDVTQFGSPYNPARTWGYDEPPACVASDTLAHASTLYAFTNFNWSLVGPQTPVVTAVASLGYDASASPCGYFRKDTYQAIGYAINLAVGTQLAYQSDCDSNCDDCVDTAVTINTCDDLASFYANWNTPCNGGVPFPLSPSQWTIINASFSLWHGANPPANINATCSATSCSSSFQSFRWTATGICPYVLDTCADDGSASCYCDAPSAYAGLVAAGYTCNVTSNLDGLNGGGYYTGFTVQNILYCTVITWSNTAVDVQDTSAVAFENAGDPAPSFTNALSANLQVLQASAALVTADVATNYTSARALYLAGATYGSSWPFWATTNGIPNGYNNIAPVTISDGTQPYLAYLYFTNSAAQACLVSTYQYNPNDTVVTNASSLAGFTNYGTIDGATQSPTFSYFGLTKWQYVQQFTTYPFPAFTNYFAPIGDGHLTYGPVASCTACLTNAAWPTTAAYPPGFPGYDAANALSRYDLVTNGAVYAVASTNLFINLAFLSTNSVIAPALLPLNTLYGFQPLDAWLFEDFSVTNGFLWQ